MLRRTSPLTFAVVSALVLAPATASAGGFEYAAAGTRPLGRAGAFFARADDPMALFYNPAMLADLPDHQLQLQSHLAFLDMCADRTGTYRDTIPEAAITGDTRFGTVGANPWHDEEMPRVCRDGYPGPSPDLVQTIRILPELAIGFGILAPAGVGNARWGQDASVRTAGGNLAPSPLRYALAEQDLLLFHPSVGVGWRITDWIRVGLTFQWGIADVRFVNFSTSSGAGDQDPFNDVRTELRVFDWFVPAGILSVHVQPHPNVDVVAWGRLHDAVGGVTDASGTLSVTTRYFSTTPGSEPSTTTVPGVTLRAYQPYQFALGVRYADRIRPRPWERGFEAAVRGVVDDPMYSERFDVELDVVYEVNSLVTDHVVDIPDDATATIDGAAVVPLPDVQIIPKRWSDVLAIRLGGDWNVVPGTFAMRAGFHTEIPFTRSPYQVHDNISGYRFGLHLGTTLRLERFDVSLAYAHIFQLDMTITDGQFRQSASQCRAEDGCMPPVVNDGTYTSEWNVLSLGVGYHFD